MKNEIVLFTDGDVNIEVQINPEQETVWLTQKQMEVLFDVKHATVSEHISNILASGELDETSVGFSDKSSLRSNITFSFMISPDIAGRSFLTKKCYPQKMHFIRRRHTENVAQIKLMALRAVKHANNQAAVAIRMDRMH